MLPKTKGAVGCAHCQKLGDAHVSCRSCNRPVCQACAARPVACPRPRPFALPLPRRLRIAQLGPCGRRALTRRLIGAPRGFDMHALKSYRLAQPVSTRGVIVRTARPPDERAAAALELAITSIGDDCWYIEPQTRARLSVCPAGKLLVSVRDDRAAIYEIGAGFELINTHRMPAQLIHSAAIDARSGVLALGGNSMVQLVRFERRGAESNLGAWPLREGGDVAWVGLTRSQIIAVTRWQLYIGDIAADEEPRAWSTRAQLIFAMLGDRAPSTIDSRVIDWWLDAKLAALDPQHRWLALAGRRLGGRAAGRRGVVRLVSLVDERHLLLDLAGVPRALRFIDEGRHLVVAERGLLRYWPRESLT